MRHKTADLEPTAFGGRYTLLRRLAVGGMAEIYLARQAAMAGFEKEVVIKRLRVELADDPRIVEMFLDEARIGALLNHPNIVHVYDVDEHDGIPYIAMEYIIGEELNELCRRGIQYERFLPLEHAVELMRQAAAGLGYFHAKRSIGGIGSGAPASHHPLAPLDIVHLDISPSNLLVTQDGFLKVIDFGIARARGQSHRGDVMPGKLSYMSPEQAARGEVDHRSDIFSLGIVMYEITVGRRLFRGNAAEIVPKLIAGEVEPPTFARRNFPPALESIVMRALERHPGDRYQTAYDLADDLETFLRDERLHSGPVRIARYLDLLTHAAGGQRRPELISEGEARATGDDLDFDSQVFDGYRPNENAPPPEQAREWDDADEAEGEVAAALGMELDELRALRTPVPVRPAGMAPVTGASGPLESAAAIAPVEPIAEPPAVPEPPKRATTDEGDGEVERRATTDDGEGDVEVDLGTPPRGIAPLAVPRAQSPVPRPVSVVAAGVPERPPIGARLLPPAPRAGAPWSVVTFLAVAVVLLVAYILRT